MCIPSSPPYTGCCDGVAVISADANIGIANAIPKTAAVILFIILLIRET
jgi:hypothetical protein